MKKPITGIAVLMITFALVFSSCKKKYRCACTHAGGTILFNYELEKQKKKDAKAACQAKITTVLGPAYTCELY